MLFYFIPLVLFCSYVSGGNSFPDILTPEEEEKYLQDYANGDMDAKNKLIEHNLRLVAHIVKKYTGTNKESASDLISVGTIGLIKGVNTYKPDKKTKLATYAAKCIENAILTLRKHCCGLMHCRKNGLLSSKNLYPFDSSCFIVLCLNFINKSLSRLIHYTGD